MKKCSLATIIKIILGTYIRILVKGPWNLSFQQISKWFLCPRLFEKCRRLPSIEPGTEIQGLYILNFCSYDVCMTDICCTLHFLGHYLQPFKKARTMYLFEYVTTTIIIIEFITVVMVPNRTRAHQLCRKTVCYLVFTPGVNFLKSWYFWSLLDPFFPCNLLF